MPSSPNERMTRTFEGATLAYLSNLFTHSPFNTHLGTDTMEMLNKFYLLN